MNGSPVKVAQTLSSPQGTRGFTEVFMNGIAIREMIWGAGAVISDQ